MAEAKLRAIGEEVAARARAAARSRSSTGSARVPLSEPSVIVAASAPHRGEAFERRPRADRPREGRGADLEGRGRRRRRADPGGGHAPARLAAGYPRRRAAGFRCNDRLRLRRPERVRRRRVDRGVAHRDAHQHGRDPVTRGDGDATPAALDPLDWRSAQHTGQPLSLVRARSGFLGVETRAVAALTRSGSFRWRSKSARTDAFRGLVAGGVPVAVPGRTAQGLDPRTGRVRWSHPSTKYAFTDGRRVYAPAARHHHGLRPPQRRGPLVGPGARQRGAEPDRQRRARRPDLPDRRCPALPRARPGERGDPCGDRPRPRDHYLHARRRATSSTARLGLHTHGALTGYSLDGAVAWRRALKLGRDRGKRCDAYLARDVSGDVALNALTGPALLLDAATRPDASGRGRGGANIDGTAGGRLVVELRDRQRTLGVDARAQAGPRGPTAASPARG